MGLFSNLKKATNTTPVPPPKMKKGEYVWKATVYKHKFLKDAEDVDLYSERFWIEAQAKAFKKSVEAGLARNTVRYEKVSVLETDGFLA